MATKEVEQEFPNVGEGPETYSLADAFEDVDAVVLLLQRDYYCGKCRDQTKEVAKRYDDFAERDAEVVVVLPEPRSKAERWAKKMDLPFPLLADEDAKMGEKYGQEVRFGVLGRLHDLLGRMPVALVLARDEQDIEVAYEHNGDSYGDRPSVDELLGHIEDT